MIKLSIAFLLGCFWALGIIQLTQPAQAALTCQVAPEVENLAKVMGMMQLPIMASAPTDIRPGTKPETITQLIEGM